MKEQMVFIAVDADDVGEKIGNAVLGNDVESLSSISNNINSGTQVFSQWAEHEGGRVVSSGSDEAIMEIPQSSLENLEKVKEAYTQQTGFTICIGTGASVSEAAKALIYAKMNGKNQIIDYSPQIEEVMKQSISGDLTEDISEQEISDKSDIPEQEISDKSDIPEHEQNLSPEDKAIHDSTEEMSDEEEVEQEQLAAQAEEGVSEEEMVEAPESEMEEPAMEEDAMEEMVDSDDPSDEDIDLDGIPDQQEEHGEIDPERDDLDGDGDVEHEEAMVSEENADEYSDEDDYEDEINEDEDFSESIAAEMVDESEEEVSEEMPAEMIEEEAPMEEAPMEEEVESEMMEEEAPMEEEIPMEEGVEPEMEGDATEALKDVIYDSLQSFRQHREHLARISEENPELYKALIYTLQAMIEMAKELGYGDAAEDLMEGEAVDSEDFSEEQMEEPAMEEAEEEEGEEEAEEEEGEEEAEEEDFVKNEKLLSLIKTMAKTVNKLKLLKSKSGTTEDETLAKANRFERERGMSEGAKKMRRERRDKQGAPGGKAKQKGVHLKPGNYKKRKKESDEKYKTRASKKADQKSRERVKIAGTEEIKPGKKKEDGSNRTEFGIRERKEKNKKRKPLSPAQEAMVNYDKPSKKKNDPIDQHNYDEKAKEESKKYKKTESTVYKSESSEEKIQQIKEKMKSKAKAKVNSGKKRKPSVKKPSVPGKKDKKKAKESNDGSFCAKSHKKMRAAGKDCRSNEDKTSPLCSARKKFNCRGKNEEKGNAVAKSEKLASFLKKKELEKTSGGLSTDRVGQYKGKDHVSKPHHGIGTIKENKKIKIQNEDGEEVWVNASAGFDGKDPNGQPLPAEADSLVSTRKPQPSKTQKVGKV